VAVVEAVERYVYEELRDAVKYSNREPLDESGIWSLHALAARIYAKGWEDGERATERKRQDSHIRATEAARREREALFTKVSDGDADE
jgi:hypothetical protein